MRAYLFTRRAGGRFEINEGRSSEKLARGKECEPAQSSKGKQQQQPKAAVQCNKRAAGIHLEDETRFDTEALQHRLMYVYLSSPSARLEGKERLLRSQQQGAPERIRLSLGITQDILVHAVSGSCCHGNSCELHRCGHGSIYLYIGKIHPQSASKNDC